MRKLNLVLAILCIVLLFVSVDIMANDKYPTKPITAIVPFGAGGMTDISTRLVLGYIEKIFGQRIIVENKSGGAGIIGAEYFLDQAKKDGYTVLFAATNVLIGPIFQGGEAFDINKFKFIGAYMSQERPLLAPIDAPYDTWEEFVDYVKKHPGQVSFGSGAAVWAYNVMKSIAVKEGLELKYVMFQSGAEASAAIMGGHVDVCEVGVGVAAWEAAEAGELKVLFNLGSGDIKGYPEIKNPIDMGYPFSANVAYGIELHAEAPEYIRETWEDALNIVMQDQDLLNRMKELGLAPHFVNGQGWKKIWEESLSVKELLEYIK